MGGGGGLGGGPGKWRCAGKVEAEVEGVGYVTLGARRGAGRRAGWRG